MTIQHSFFRGEVYKILHIIIIYSFWTLLIALLWIHSFKLFEIIHRQPPMASQEEQNIEDEIIDES